MVLVLLGIGATACGAETLETPRTLAATGAWARVTPEGASRGVVYLSVTTDRRDAVVSAAVPSTVARAATLHETMTEGDAGHHGGSGGEMTMAPVDRIVMVPGTPLAFEPGGKHVMLDDLVAPLQRGERFEMVLELESGRSITAQVVVGDGPAESTV